MPVFLSEQERNLCVLHLVLKMIIKTYGPELFITKVFIDVGVDPS